MGSENTPRGCE